MSDADRHTNLAAKNLKIRHRVVAELASKYLPKHGRVLEIGAGNGRLLGYLQALRSDAYVFAADAFQECLDEVQKNVSLTGSFKLGEEEYEINKTVDESFDVIILSHVLEHIRDPITVLRACQKMLRDEGVLVLAVPNTGRPDVLFYNLIRKRYANLGHVYGWDRSHWMNFLENILGLDVVEYASDIVKLPGASRFNVVEKVGYWLAAWFPWWSVSSISVVRK